MTTALNSSPLTTLSQPSTPEKEKMEVKNRFLSLINQALDNANYDEWTLLRKNWQYQIDKGTYLPPIINQIFERLRNENIHTFLRYCVDNAQELKEACTKEKAQCARKLNFDSGNESS